MAELERLKGPTHKEDYAKVEAHSVSPLQKWNLLNNAATVTSSSFHLTEDNFWLQTFCLFLNLLSRNKKRCVQ